MKSRWLALFTGVFFASVALPLQAADLMEVYYQAVHADPTFKKAQADWQSAKENLPIARAGYLPQFNITGDWQRQYTHISPLTTVNANGTNTNSTYLLTLTQPIFNLVTWKAIKSAKASVKAATATYAAAAQDLMVRASTAYFSVLQAYDQLRYTLSRKRAVYQQLQQAEEQFKVGLIAITGVYDARSVYDGAAATAIGDQNRLNDAVENLRAITGRHYIYMKGIHYAIPLVRPTPNDINQWVRVAEHQNYSLRAQDYSVISARETIKQQAAGWMPQVNFVGSYTEDRDTKVGIFPTTTTEGATAGLQLNFPLFQGGLVSAQTRQAEFNYLAASSQLLFVERGVVSDTRKSFLGIVTGIAQVKADLAAVKSASNALEATKVGYEVGTRTMVDVLDDVTALYQQQQRYTDDQYRYIIDTIELKANAGTLKPQDLKIINSWLKKQVKLNLPLAAFGPKLQPIGPPPQVTLKKKATPLMTRTGQLEQTANQIESRIVRLKKHVAMPVVHTKKKPVQKKQPVKQTVKLKKAIKQAEKQLQLPAPMQLLRKQLQLPQPISTRPAMQKLPAPKKTVDAAKKIISPDDEIIPLYEHKSQESTVIPSPA